MAPLVETCDRPSGYVDNALDQMIRHHLSVHWLREACDEVDNNCDGVIDENGALGSTSWYLDADSDGYGGVGSLLMGYTAQWIRQQLRTIATMQMLLSPNLC